MLLLVLTPFGINVFPELHEQVHKNGNSTLYEERKSYEILRITSRFSSKSLNWLFHVWLQALDGKNSREWFDFIVTFALWDVKIFPSAFQWFLFPPLAAFLHSLTCKFLMFYIFLSINASSYSFESVANLICVIYSDSTSYIF